MHNEELHTLSSTNTIRIIKHRRMKHAKQRSACRASVNKKTPLGKPE
jgi:hypothetical protein